MLYFPSLYRDDFAATLLVRCVVALQLIDLLLQGFELAIQVVFLSGEFDSKLVFDAVLDLPDMLRDQGFQHEDDFSEAECLF